MRARSLFLGIVGTLLVSSCTTPPGPKGTAWSVPDVGLMGEHWARVGDDTTATSQRDRGLALYCGLGLPVNLQDGLNLLTKAARQGDPVAIGFLKYHFGSPGAGKPTDEQKQILVRPVASAITLPAGLDRWLVAEAPQVRPRKKEIVEANTRAAVSGDATAMFNLAVESSLGRFAPINGRQSMNWLRKASEAGIPEAKALLAFELLRAATTAAELERGRALMAEAADAGARFALDFMVGLVESKSPLAPSPADLVRYLGKLADKDSQYLETWFEAARSDAAFATAKKTALERALLLRLPFALEEQARELQAQKKMVEALPLFEEAADQGRVSACLALGDYYFEEKPGAESFEPALRWYTRAAELGSMRANIRVSRLYGEDLWGKRDDAVSFQWLERAARRGDAWSQRELGLRLQYGRGIEKDLDEAETWFRLAVKGNNDWAHASLAFLLLNHQRSPERESESLELSMKALRTLSEAWMQNNFRSAYSALGVRDRAAVSARVRPLYNEPNLEKVAGALPELLLELIERSLVDLDQATLRAFVQRQAVAGRQQSMPSLVRLCLFDRGLDYDPVKIRVWASMMEKNEMNAALIDEVESIIGETATARKEALERFTAYARKNPGKEAYRLVLRSATGIGAPLNHELALELMNKVREVSKEAPLADVTELTTYLRISPTVPPDHTAHGEAIRSASSVAGDQALKPFYQARPRYPIDLRREDTSGSGKVDVEFIVDETGKVIEAWARKSPHPLFAEAAVQAVSSWLFIPGFKEGRPVKTRAMIAIRFELEN